MSTWTDCHKWLVRYGDEPLEAEDLENLAMLTLMISPDDTTPYGSTVAHFAAITKNALLLLPVLKQCGVNLHLTNDEGATPLHWAARNEESPQAVMMLLQMGANPRKCDKLGQTPLHYAAECGNLLAARILLRSNPGLLHQTDDDDETALGVAVEAGQRRMVRFLRQCGAGVKESHVFCAITSDSYRLLQTLLEGADCFSPDHWQRWCQWADSHDHPRALRFLRPFSSCVSSM